MMKSRDIELNRAYLCNLLKGNGKFNNKKLVIWGTGNTSVLYQEGFKRLDTDSFSVFAYADNNEAKWGTIFEGKKVLSPNEVCQIENAVVLINSPQPNVVKKVSEQMDKAGLSWGTVDEFLFLTYREKVLQAYDLLSDEKSKELYVHLIECRMKSEYPDDEYVDTEQYFSFGHFGDANPNEVFVDCGAYVGDSLERYIWNKDGVFGRIIAFEPDKSNLQAMNYRVDRLCKEWNIKPEKIEIYPYGVSNENTVKNVSRYSENNGFGSKISEDASENTEECKLISLDSFFNEKVDFIKADIESYEYKLLLGSKEIVSKFSPKLAICIYHNGVDFFSIIELLHNLNPNYRFSIRHYTHVLSDSVLYAY